MLFVEPRRTSWDLKWTMFHVPVRVHPLFWLVALALSYHRDTPFSYVLISMAAILFSLLVHEFGHALAGRHFGDESNSVVLYSVGGLCVPGSDPAGFWPRIWILFWGPGAGLVLGVLAAGLLLLIPDPSGALLAALRALIWFNLVWGAINLLVPVFPLDAGQILRETVLLKAPQRGDPLVFAISFYAALVAAAGTLVYALFSGDSDWVSFYPCALFAMLAYSSYQIRRQLREGAVPGGADERRQPWEQDPDWWKRK